jgi:hypothetical protein
MRLWIRGLLIIVAGTGAGLFIPGVLGILHPESYHKDDMFFIWAGIGAGLLGAALVGVFFVFVDSLLQHGRRSWPRDSAD